MNNLDIEKQIRNIDGLMTKNQYRFIANIVKDKTPCNILVFGLGNDSYLWELINKSGKNVFVENVDEWINKFSDLEIIKVNYKTNVTELPSQMTIEKLLLNLPNSIFSTKWDIIIVDGPVGHNPPCLNCKLCSKENPAPGRMSSIFTSSKLCSTDTIVIIDDINREIEKEMLEICFIKTEKIKNILYNDNKLIVFRTI